VTEPRIYLDHAATTPVLPPARGAMAEALGRWANPSSPHAEGRAARAALEDARARIKTALGWTGELIFTSGASEAISIVIDRAKADHVFVSPIEHDAVLRAAPSAERLALRSTGIVHLADLEGARPLVAVQHANNEVGLLQPLDTIAADVRVRGGLLLADCAQTAGKLPLPEADFVAISAHKFGGPPGVGALLIRDLSDLRPSGGQESGYRGGTENLPAIIGMAAALEAGCDWVGRASRLRTRLDEALLTAEAQLICARSPRIPTIGAYRMPGVAAQAQLIQLDLAGIAISAGSACSSGSLKPSHVLAALGLGEAEAREVIRVSFGPATTEAEIDRFAAAWRALAERRRAA
jgi:cysteine desulfurase